MLFDEERHTDSELLNDSDLPDKKIPDRLLQEGGLSRRKYEIVVRIVSRFKPRDSIQEEDLEEIALLVVLESKPLWIDRDDVVFVRVVLPLIVEALKAKISEEKRLGQAEDRFGWSHQPSCSTTGQEFENEEYLKFLVSGFDDRDRTIVRAKLEGFSGAEIGKKLGLTGQRVNEIYRNKIIPAMRRAHWREMRNAECPEVRLVPPSGPNLERVREKHPDLRNLKDREIKLYLNILRYLRRAKTPPCLKNEDLEGYHAGDLPSRNMKSWDRCYSEPRSVLEGEGLVVKVKEYSTDNGWCRIWKVRRLW